METGTTIVPNVCVMKRYIKKPSESGFATIKNETDRQRVADEKVLANNSITCEDLIGTERETPLEVCV